MGSYIPNTRAQQEAMLAALGVDRVEDLFAAVPREMLVDRLDLPEGLSELEVRRQVTAMAAKNKIYDTVLRGAGAYRHFIPSVVKSVVSREELVTAYTPYQAEISQGILQSIFEYQTMICALTGMEVSNASVYDGSTAAAEALAMCRERKRNTAYVSACADPQTIAVMRTYCFGSGMELEVIPERDGRTDLEALKTALGAEGLRQAAKLSMSKAHYLACELEKIGMPRIHAGEYFHEFVCKCEKPEAVLKALDENGILGGLPVEGGVLWCVTELVSRDELDRAVSIIKEVC